MTGRWLKYDRIMNKWERTFNQLFTLFFLFETSERFSRVSLSRSLCLFDYCFDKFVSYYQNIWKFFLENFPEYVVKFIYIFISLYFFIDKGKPFERLGRKATGLRCFKR
jgi:hypothetical protein